MKKSSQNQPVDATTLAFPEHVSVAMAEIAEHVGEGLLALAVGAGLQVMQTLMDADVTALAGPKGKHDQGRIAVRHGREHGSVSLGGRRVPVTRPRVRAADGTGELPIPSYELFTSTEILGKMAMEKMPSLGCPPVAIRWAWNQSGRRSPGNSPRRQASRRSHAGSWR